MLEPLRPLVPEDEDIVLSLDVPRPPGFWNLALRKFTRRFPAFARELGSLVVLSGVFGALAKTHPSPATNAMYALVLFGTTAFLANYFAIRLKFQYLVKETAAQNRATFWANMIIFVAASAVVTGWIFEITNILTDANIIRAK